MLKTVYWYQRMCTLRDTLFGGML